LCAWIVFFFFKQKTAYEMRISDWSSDVCSSDLLNARFLLNAANARWGSLYDALYGTDALPGTPAGTGYDPVRGAAVIGWARTFLDSAAPLVQGSWTDWDGTAPALADPAQLVGRAGDNLLLKRHGLHIEIVIDRSHQNGRPACKGKTMSRPV